MDTSKVKEFINKSEKSRGENVSGMVRLHPADQLDWSNSGYLDQNRDGKQYMELYGKLVYKGLAVTGNEKYLLRTKLGNFRLFKNDHDKMIAEKFLPSSSSRRVPRSDL